MNYIPTQDVGDDTGAAQEEYNATAVDTSRDNNKTMSEEKETNVRGGNNKLVIVAILAFLIGFGVGFLVFSDRGGDTEVVDEVDVADSEAAVVESTEPVEPVTVTGVSLSVNDQNFGGEVVLSSATLDRTSWVVVFEDNEGQPGSILGAQLYDAGDVADGAVSLLRGTVADSLYYVKVHSDDGDRQFDFTKDVPVLDAEGDEVSTTFMTISGQPR